MNFILALKEKNETLYAFGLLCFIASVVFLALTKFSNTEVYNVSAWYKPFKFAFSTFLFAWAMAWYCSVILALLYFALAVFTLVQALQGRSLFKP